MNVSREGPGSFEVGGSLNGKIRMLLSHRYEFQTNQKQPFFERASNFCNFVLIHSNVPTFFHESFLLFIFSLCGSADLSAD